MSGRAWASTLVLLAVMAVLVVAVVRIVAEVLS